LSTLLICSGTCRFGNGSIHCAIKSRYCRSERHQFPKFNTTQWRASSGAGITVGQAEAARPAKLGTDTSANTNVVPAGVALLDGQAVIPNENIGDEPANPIPDIRHW